MFVVKSEKGYNEYKELLNEDDIHLNAFIIPACQHSCWVQRPGEVIERGAGHGAHQQGRADCRAGHHVGANQ